LKRARWLCWTSGVFFAARAALGDATDVVIVGDRASAETAALEFELRAAGLRPIVRDDIALDEIDPENVTLDVGAIVALRQRGARRAIWIVDRVTRKLVVRSLPLDASADPRTVAVSAVELLQASLMELASRAPSAPVIAPTPAVRAVVARAFSTARAAPIVRPPRQTDTGRSTLVGGAFGGGVVGTWGDVALQPRGMAAIDLSIARWLRVSVVGGLSLAPARLDFIEGAVELQNGYVGVRGGVVATQRASRLHLSSGAGLGLGWIGARGDARRGYTGREDHYLGPRFELWTRVGVRLFGQFVIGLDAAATTLGGPLNIRVGERIVATQGALVLDAVLFGAFAIDTTPRD
jgi:hypothetical protein